MTKEHKICVRQISDKLLVGIYKSIGYAIILMLILIVSFFFIYPHYEKYSYMQECLKDNYSQKWCERTWQELLALD